MSTSYSDVELDDESDDGGYYDYYDSSEVDEILETDHQESDPEYFEFNCLDKEEVKRMLNENVEKLCAKIPVKPSLAKLLLHIHKWETNDLITSYQSDASKLLADSRIEPSPKPQQTKINLNSRTLTCVTCFSTYSREHFSALACNHYFCKDCWFTYFEMQITQGLTTAIECMAHECTILVPEDFVLRMINKSPVREKYQQFSFCDYVKSHLLLRFCPGANCNVVVFAKECQAKRATCKQCQTNFCFKCGSAYHAPLDCNTVKKWAQKCTDDSETANYISVNTKDCPFCHACIEKNGGCNHMSCWNCKRQFCWICLGEWNGHVKCNAYEENTRDASLQSQAREALSKYLFYFERWENHNKSLKLEELNIQKIRNQISAKVMAKEGSWIDWQYLLDAATLLAKCRYTLQYTYPYAYYMEVGARKKLFEYQQAELEKEIESLSWKVENVVSTDRADLENQMNIAEIRRLTLLKDFLVA
ncbi:potential E3 ubiquitin-protein ligase ariadne-2 [Parasteatoda tepidariorum]|uniref:potential E3 ubiquitin-protein ligase ariadne-2 n=1 Tax=Parasteatoda tepidariorum TaxID=114398 RepID=UPI00077FE2C1|nr:potential E3 ubiquitin-protein ligase ariadne-2 [Parasteatoda tepidariorum]XP_042896064.1 potential E3 ubiquitin-protein ligase ariadne-2 [Parasteatoda tepidariorum]